MASPTSAQSSWLRLHQFIGGAGILLPFLCLFGGSLMTGNPILPSVSDYYHSNMRDLLEGILVLTGALLVTYKGYGKWDDRVTTTSGVLALGIALFPYDWQSPMHPAQLTGLLELPTRLSNQLHMVCAVGFFSLLAVNSLFLFPSTGPDEGADTPAKRRRDRLYRICGLVMGATLVLLGLAILVLGIQGVNALNLLLWGEFLLLGAFGVSWLVKGHALRSEP